MLMEIMAYMGLAKAKWYVMIRTLFIAIAMLWLRMVFHYMGQYVLLKLMGCPVTDVGI